MSFPGIPSTVEQIETMRRYLDGPDRSEDDLRYDELPGFLFAIASAPILVRPSEWLPDVLGDDSEFETKEEAQAVMSAMMASYNASVKAAQSGGPIDPEDVGIDMSSESSLRSWSRGFLTGFSGVHAAWQEALQSLDKEDRDRFHAIIPVLLIWANPEKYKGTNDAGDEELEKFLEVCRTALPAALGTLAAMGIEIHRASLTGLQSAGRRPVVSSNAVGRNDPCPCGSGKKYKRCCGVN
jgi:uncharacterized protein